MAGLQQEPVVACSLSLVGARRRRGSVVYKIQRDNQEITITTDDPDIEVVMKRKGEVVRIVDKKSGQIWKYDTIKNRIGLADQPDGLQLELPQGGSIVMKRQGDKDARVFTIARNPKPEAPETISSATGAEAIERFLKLLDERNFARCWEESAQALREGVTKREFVGQQEAVLNPLGELKERTVLRWQSAGDVLTRHYTSNYANGECEEHITAIHGKDKLWRVGSYQVIPKAKKGPSPSQGGLIHNLRWPGGNMFLDYTIFSPDGKYFLVGGEHTSAVWETATAKLMTTFDVLPGAVFLPDNRHVLAASGNERLVLWDVVGDKEVRQFERHNASEGYLSVSADGKRGLSWKRDIAVLWDVETGKPLVEYRPKHDGLGFIAKLAPDGKAIATVGVNDRTARLWDADQKKEIKSWKVEGNAVYGVITFLPDGRSFVTQADYGGGRIVRFDMKSDKSAPVADVQYEGAAGVSPNGRFALLHDGKTAVRGHDLVTGLDLGRVILPSDVRGSIGISPDGRDGAARPADRRPPSDRTGVRVPLARSATNTVRHARPARRRHRDSNRRSRPTGRSTTLRIRQTAGGSWSPPAATLGSTAGRLENRFSATISVRRGPPCR